MTNLISNVRFLSCLFVAAGLAAQGSQVTLNVNPSPVVQSGQQATITYNNAARAGQTIGVVVRGGVPQVDQTVTIKLDANGYGTGTWTAPNNWPSATFIAPEANSVRVTIQ